MGYTGRDDVVEKKSLASLFRNDKIAAGIASHVHYSDLVNVSLSSKRMRGAVFHSGGAEHRSELLAERSCEEDKGECWACAVVICSVCDFLPSSWRSFFRSQLRLSVRNLQTCKVDKEKVTCPRTGRHMANCHAICARCYFLRGTIKPAPFLATLKPGDLSLQHCGCGCTDIGVSLEKYAVAKSQPTQTASLCPHCGSVSPQQVSEFREERETRALQISLRRRLYCATCEKRLPRTSMRWWICSAGNHECHWKGHDVVKKM